MTRVHINFTGTIAPWSPYAPMQRIILAEDENGQVITYGRPKEGETIADCRHRIFEGFWRPRPVMEPL